LNLKVRKLETQSKLK